MTVRVHWIKEEREGHDSYGYRAQSLHTRTHAEDHGLEDDPSAPVVVRTCSPHRFRRYDDRLHVLYTNVEAPLWPEQVAAANRADLIVTISEHCARLIRAAVRPDLPVEVCPLGISRVFAPRRREAPSGGQPFRWLWVGAPSPRKGWDRLTGGLAPGYRGGVWFEHGWHERGDVELYMKFSNHVGGGVVTDGNVIYDSRRLTDEELADLYYSAHAFVMPTYGEGFGLTLAEAMATGLPALCTLHGGHSEFAAGAARGVDSEEVDGSTLWPDRYPNPTPVHRACLHNLNAEMYHTGEWSFGPALENGRRIYDRLTWDATGARFVEILTGWLATDPQPYAPSRRKAERVGVYFANGLGNWLMYTPALRAIRRTLQGARVEVVLAQGGDDRTDYTRHRELLSAYAGDLIDDVVSVGKEDPVDLSRWDLTIAHPHGEPSRWKDQMGLDVGLAGPEFQREHEVLSLMRIPRELGYRGDVPPMEYPGETWRGDADGPVVICNGSNPRSNDRRKRWTDDGFRRLADALTGWLGCDVVQVGGPGEYVGGCVIDRTGSTVEETAEILRGARLFVTVDTFAMHLGCALSVPLVAIFGPSSVTKNGPWADAPHEVVCRGISCSPCWGQAGWTSCADNVCMQGVEVGDVMAAARRVLTKAAGRMAA